MSAFLVRRLGLSLVTLWIVTLIVFGLMHWMPGDTFGEGQGGGLKRIDPETRQAIRAKYGLDLPLHRRYAAWLSRLAVGDLGRSHYDGRPVVESIAARLPLTLTLNSAALLLTMAIAVPLGTLAALRPGSVWDRLAGPGGYVLYALPVFWVGMLLQLLFAVQLRWLPLFGSRSLGADELSAPVQLVDTARHMILPVVTLSYGGVAYLSRFVRVTLLDGAAPDNCRAARARGLSPRATLLRHGFRQALIPLLTLFGFLLPALVGGSVIVETIFALPGMGRLFVESALARDTPILLGWTLLSGIVTIVGIAFSDLAYRLVDPRMRRE